MFFEIGKGVFNTLIYTAVSFFFSFFLAHFIAIYNSCFNNIFSRFLKFYVSVFRGTPVIVQLYIIYFAIPQLFHIESNGFVSVIIALSLNSAAYMSEIVRAGIQAIDKGQFEAARVLNIPSYLMWKDIILKQVFFLTIPNICNEFVNLLKETAIVSTVGENDILKRAFNLGAQTYSFMEPLLIAAFYYYILIMILMQVSRYIERRMGYDSY